MYFQNPVGLTSIARHLTDEGLRTIAAAAPQGTKRFVQGDKITAAWEQQHLAKRPVKQKLLK